MRALPLLLCTFAAAACHRGAVAPINPQAEVAVNVDNQNFLDINVFLARGGQRIRLGTVPGLTPRILMARPALVGWGTDRRSRPHPVGGGSAPLPEPVRERAAPAIH